MTTPLGSIVYHFHLGGKGTTYFRITIDVQSDIHVSKLNKFELKLCISPLGKPETGGKNNKK